MTADVPRDMNALANGIDAKVGVAGGLATLGADGKVPAEQLSVQAPADASTTRKGVVQLNDAVNSTSTTQAATPNAVKKAYDEALAGKQAGIDRKAEVVAALNSIGVAASTSESWAQLIPKMAAIIRATGNATAADVLTGKLFSNAGANGLTGTMPNRGAGGTVTPGTTNQTKAAGYYSSAITILGDLDLVSSNIRSGTNVFNVLGTLIPGKRFVEGSVTPTSGAVSIPFNAEFAPKIILLWRGSGDGTVDNDFSIGVIRGAAYMPLFYCSGTSSSSWGSALYYNSGVISARTYHYSETYNYRIYE